MKALSLFAFATVFLLSSALPDGNVKGRHGSLLDSKGHQDGVSLQRRKPPVKIPGPALLGDESYQGITHQDANLSDDSKRMYLMTDKSKKHIRLDSLHNENDRGKPKHLVNADDDSKDKEESQEKEKGKPYKFDWDSA